MSRHSHSSQGRSQRHLSPHVISGATVEELEVELASILEYLDLGSGSTLTATLRGQCGLSFTLQVQPLGRIDALLPMGVLVNGMDPQDSISAIAQLVAWGWEWPQATEWEMEDAAAEITAGIRCNWSLPDCSVLDSFDWVPALKKSWPRCGRSPEVADDYIEVAREVIVAFSLATFGCVPVPLHLEALNWPVHLGSPGHYVDLSLAFG